MNINHFTFQNYSAFEFYLYFPFKIGSILVISLFTFFFVGYFFIYHIVLVYEGVTSLEKKYGLNTNFYSNKNDIKTNYTIKYNLIRRIGKRFLSYLRNLHTNLLKVLESKSVFELYWPD